MGRPKRIQFPGACYFLRLEGNNRQDIFLSNQDKRFFLSLLRTYNERYRLKIYAYALMSNNASLLLETGAGNLSTVMQGFNTVYTKYFNTEHNTSGHLFGGRFKALLVDKEKFLLEMATYVHLECVRAGLKGKPWRYQWSSCSAYVESGRSELLVDSETVLRRFGRVRLKQSVEYLKFIKGRMKSALQTIVPVTRGQFIGGEEFAAKVRKYCDSLEPDPAASKSGTPAGEAEARRIIAEVAKKQGIGTDDLLGTSQWREVSAARHQAVYRVWGEVRLRVTEIARIFNRTPSAISQVIRSKERRRESG